jgi:predicted solute-binding protein
MALSFKMQDCIAKKIEEHEKTYDPSVTRDFIDLYIKHKEENHGTISGE